MLFDLINSIGPHLVFFKVGGLWFWKFGRLGGSFYWSK